jgi:hypothetical protein
MKLEFVEFMPSVKEPGVLYISETYGIAIHMCPCKCGIESVTPFGGPQDWTLTKENPEMVTLNPSLLNPCGTHYWVRRNEIVLA